VQVLFEDTSMTLYDAFLALGAIVVFGIILKGFRSAYKVKALDQPDNWQNPGGPDGSGGHH
jgi:hypothetical protein